MSDRDDSLAGRAFDERLRPVVRFMEEAIPYNAHLGLKVVAITPGRAVMRLPWADHLIGDPSRPAVHGGVTSALIDTTGGLACWSMLPSADDRLSTVDLRIDYLRPGPPEDLLCEARVVRMGNKVAVARMEVFAGALPPEDSPESTHHPIATGQGVYNVIRKG